MERCHSCEALVPVEAGIYARHVVCPVTLCASCARTPSEYEKMRSQVVALEAHLAAADALLGEARTLLHGDYEDELALRAKIAAWRAR